MYAHLGGDTFHKILNPDVQAQMCKIEMYDAHDTPYTIDQWYYLDAMNKYYLLHPNYENKLERYNVIDLL